MESDNMNLWEYYHNDATGFGSIKNHLLILYSIAVGMKAQVIVEVGMCRGDSTRAFLEAAKKINGIVYSIDRLEYSETIEMLTQMELNKNHRFIRGESTTVAESWRIPIDLLLLDAGHQYKEHEEDFNAWKNHVREGGIVLIHDVDPNNPHHDGYKHFSEKIMKFHNTCFLPFGGGLGILVRQ